ncbi:MAG TPA: aminotransferase class V-fold PLP-dependent enzyme [Candidatus Cloacimonadota bacterium]|jgi:threonine aldolase|nr:aminotransferase class V-fold PLP-dependent enzyme [Candidatus Cloacimonadales bacterium]HPY96486.1 aminotransferase class V-fold PLP-dependent enzyme [Candidatus Cloacimonadota bacterium]HQB41714.1 aminotransferase class V-fold PLP-dependent enzyme [Candidatus Cloacimonadota bacterium]
MKKSFASDNNAGIHPLIMDAIIKANEDDYISYGDDFYTQEAEGLFKKVFGSDIDVFFVLNGTGANATALKAMLHSFEAIVCPETAHIAVDECGAVENLTGAKLLTVPTQVGKITVEQVEGFMHFTGDQHHSQPRVISISQSTEMGTLYTQAEIKELADFAHQHEMYLHMDGARIANACAAMGIGFKSMSKDLGVDVLSFGSTKNGMGFGEAVVFFNKSLAKYFPFIRKQSMQLLSKIRYITCQYKPYFQDDLWLKNAMNANRLATLLYEKLSDIPELKITRKSEVNAVFCLLPKDKIEHLQSKRFFYTWDDASGEVRFMTSFNMCENDILEFVSFLKEELT